MAHEVYKPQGKDGTVKDHERLNFNPMPRVEIQNKIDYFFLPYNYEQSCSKNMPFKYNGDLETEKRIIDWESFSKFVFSEKEDDRKNMSKTFKGPKEEREEDIKKDFKDRVSILAVAYHNLGVE